MKKTIITFFPIIVFIGLFILLISSKGPIEQSGKTLITRLINSEVKPTEFPTATLQPSPTITPTPTPNYGYCLYVPVLMYHHIEPLDQAKNEYHEKLTVDNVNFDSQMQYLSSKGYNSISADDLISALNKQKTLPSKPIMITLDDGYADVYNYAYPIARKYNIVLNLMIPTGLMGGYGYLTWDQLRDMVNSGTVFAYDHTKNHKTLSGGSGDEEEIMGAKRDLERELGRTVSIISYPYGGASESVIKILLKNGFSAAFSTIDGTSQCTGYIFGLHRTRIGNSPLSAFGF